MLRKLFGREHEEQSGPDLENPPPGELAAAQASGSRFGEPEADEPGAPAPRPAADRDLAPELNAHGAPARREPPREPEPSLLAMAGERAEDTGGDSNAADNADEEVLRERVIQAIRTVYDPEIPVNIYDLGLIYVVDINDERHAHIKMTLTAPSCPAAGTLPGEVEVKAAAVKGISGATVDVVWEPTWNPAMMTDAAKLELGMY